MSSHKLISSSWLLWHMTNVLWDGIVDVKFLYRWTEFISETNVSTNYAIRICFVTKTFHCIFLLIRIKVTATRQTQNTISKLGRGCRFKHVLGVRIGRPNISQMLNRIKSLRALFSVPSSLLEFFLKLKTNSKVGGSRENINHWPVIQVTSLTVRSSFRL